MYDTVGICRKVKLHYFLVNHGHCDGDKDIGQGGRRIANLDLPTFESFQDEMTEAFKNVNQSHASVER